MVSSIFLQELDRLQGVQNCLARVVTLSPRFSRTTPLLKSLHWLPVCFRIKFKICLVTYATISQSISKKCLNLRNVLVIFAHLTKMCYLFLGLRPRRVKGLFLWRHQNCGIISPVKLELQKQFTLSEKKFKKIILTKLSRPGSFVSWHAQLVTRNIIPTTVLNSSSDFRPYELGTPRI